MTTDGDAFAAGMRLDEFLSGEAEPMVATHAFVRDLERLSAGGGGRPFKEALAGGIGAANPTVPLTMRRLGRPDLADLFGRMRASLDDEGAGGDAARALADILVGAWDAEVASISVSRRATGAPLDLLLWKGPDAEAAAAERDCARILHAAGRHAQALLHAGAAFARTERAMTGVTDQAAESFLRFEERIASEEGPARLLREGAPPGGPAPRADDVLEALTELDVVMVAAAVTMSRRG